MIITALDSSVILDVLTGALSSATVAEEAIRSAFREGQLICCECVVAEIAPAFAEFALARCRELMSDLGIALVPSNLESAVLAGEMFRRYRLRGGPRSRPANDFMIGAHALIHADRLLTRDRDFQKDYFQGLSVLLVP